MLELRNNNNKMNLITIIFIIDIIDIFITSVAHWNSPCQTHQVSGVPIIEH